MINVMKTNFSMLFYMKKQKNYTSGAAPIYLRITVDGHRAEITTGRECDPVRWNSKSGRANGTKEEIRNFNAFLDNLQSKVYEAHRFLSQKEEILTAEAIKNRVTGKGEKCYMLMEVFKDHNRKMAALVGTEFSPGTLERYETSLRHTQEFLEYRYRLSDIDIRKIDNALHCHWLHIKNIKKPA